MIFFRRHVSGLGSFAVFALLALVALSVGDGVASETGKAEEFARLGSELGLSLDRSVTWKGLSKDPDFDRLSNLTRDDVDLCVNYIGDPARTPFERYVAGFSAYKLDAGSYVVFIRRLLDLRARGSVSTNDIVQIVTPPVKGVPDTIYENYQRPDVQDLIKTLLALPDLEDWARKWFIFESNHGGYYERFIAWLHFMAR
jgi:hypothetical protein